MSQKGQEMNDVAQMDQTTPRKPLDEQSHFFLKCKCSSVRIDDSIIRAGPAQAAQPVAVLSRQDQIAIDGVHQADSWAANRTPARVKGARARRSIASTPSWRQRMISFSETSSASRSASSDTNGSGR